MRKPKSSTRFCKPKEALTIQNCQGFFVQKQFGELLTNFLRHSSEIHQVFLDEVLHVDALADDVFIERLWRSVKQEYVYLSPCETGDELWRGLDGYFRFYNDERPHQSLGYKTPASRYLLQKEAA